MGKLINNSNELPIEIIEEYDEDLKRWGYNDYPAVVKEMVDYSEDKYKNWNNNDTFMGDKNIVIAPNISTLGRTNLSGLFSNCTCLKEVDKLDTRSCKDLSYAFYECMGLTSIPELDTKNVTDISFAFSRCSSLTSIPRLNTENCKNFSGCFHFSKNINRIEELSFKSLDINYNDSEEYGLFSRYTIVSYSISPSQRLVYNPNTTCKYILIKDIGYNPNQKSVPLFDIKGWLYTVDGEQSLKDSLLTYSFDRKKAGYSNCRLLLNSYIYNALDDYYPDFKKAVEDKGYDFVSVPYEIKNEY